MARLVHGRVRVRWFLLAQTPLRIGGLGADNDVDLALASDGLGRPYIPGTSLAGTFRDWFEGPPDPDARQATARDGRVLDADDTAAATDKVASEIRALWGYTEDDSGAASRIVVRDALVLANVSEIPTHHTPSPRETTAASALIEIRDSVGIDRATGAAGRHALHDGAVLPRGVVIRVGLDAAVATEEELQRTVARLWLLQDALATGSLRLGAFKSRGGGRVTLADAPNAGIFVERLGTRDGMLAALGVPPKAETPCHQAAHQAPRPALSADSVLPRRRRFVSIDVDWRAEQAVMSRASLDGFAIDSLPLVSRVWNEASESDALALFLAGSAIKGALRTNAERIVRTMLGDGNDAPRSMGTQRFVDQLADGRLRLVHELFGSAPRGMIDESSSTADKALGRGALSIDPCYGTRALTREQWDRLIAPTPAGNESTERVMLDPSFRRELRALGLFDTTHVAIDRWTGGAADGLLYSILEPRGMTWEPMRMLLDLDRLRATRTGGDLRRSDNPLAHPAIALLLLTLEELRRGMIGIGFGVNRGMGEIAVDRLTLRGLDASDPLKEIEIGGLATDGMLADVQGAWDEWLSTNTIRWWEAPA